MRLFALMLILLAIISNSIRAEINPDKTLVWDARESTPFFYLGMALPPNFDVSEPFTEREFKQAATALDGMWRGRYSDRPSLYVVGDSRCVTGDDEKTSCPADASGKDPSAKYGDIKHRNEIHANYWIAEFNHPDANITTYGVTSRRYYVEGGCTRSGNCSLPKLIEADVFINPNIGWIRDSQTTECKDKKWKNFGRLDETLAHEMGHAVGLSHEISRAYLMYHGIDGIPVKCERRVPNLVHDGDWRHLDILYGPYARTTNVNINNPSEDQILFAGDFWQFSASSSNTASDATVEQSDSSKRTASSSDSIQWSSDVDGDLGVGNVVNVSDLSPGPHSIKAQVNEPGDTVFGDSVVSVKVLERSATTELDEFYPLPCSRHADYPDKCRISFNKTLVWEFAVA